MSDMGMQNPFSPPRANVQDHVEADVSLVDATRPSRFLAFLIDCAPAVVLGIVFGVGVAAYAGTHPGSTFESLVLGSGVAIALMGVAAIAWFAYNAVLVYKYGQIFGKRMMGIRVVRTDGSRVGFGRFIFLRWLPLAVVSAVLGAIFGRRGHPFWSYLVTLVDLLLIFRASRQCLHDTIADTRVVTAASSEHATLAGASGAHLRTIQF